MMSRGAVDFADKNQHRLRSYISRFLKRLEKTRLAHRLVQRNRY
jgi:hypothetical protein